MKDVFISKHDQSTVKWTEEIVKELESRNVSVWYSPRDVLSDYPTDIVKAIRNCKVFLFLFNEHSNMSEHCKNEISIAFDRYRLHDGIALLSFKTSNEDPSEDMYYFLTRIHAIDGTIPPEVLRIRELCDRICVLLEMSNEQIGVFGRNASNTEDLSQILKSEHRLKGDYIYPGKKSIERKKELERIHDQLQGRCNKLMLVGIGGIGKSELARQYAFLYGESYDIVIWLNFKKSLQETIADDTNLTIEGCIRENFSGITAEQYFQHKLKMLKNLSNRKTLIIIDDFNVADDPELENFCNGEYTVLFTTRIQELSTFVPEILLEAFCGKKELLNLFKIEYKRSMTEQDEEIILQIISHFQQHTMLIRLLGTAMQRNRISPVNLQKEDVSPRSWINLKAEANKTIMEILKEMVCITGLSKEEEYILCNLSLVSSSGMETSEFAEACGVEGFDVIDNLIRGNWIIHEAAKDRIHLHPLVREVFAERIRVAPEICKTFVQSIQNRCRYTHDKSWREKVELYNLVTSICEILSEKSESYLWMRYTCALMNMDMAEYNNTADILKDMLIKVQVPEYRCRLWNKLAQAYALNGSMDQTEDTAYAGCKEIRTYSSECLDESIRKYHLRSLLERLSEVCRKKEKYDQSIAYAEEAVKFSETLQQSHGERSFGWSLYHLASSYAERGFENDLNHAEHTLEQAVKIFKNLQDDGAVFYCDQVLGRVLTKKGRFEDAIYIFDSVFEGLNARFGEKHPDIANLYVDYGICYSLMKNYEKANTYYKMAEKIYTMHNMTEKIAYVNNFRYQRGGIINE